MQSNPLLCHFKMMQKHPPQQLYNQRLEEYSVNLSRLLKKRSTLGWVRLLVFSITTLLAYKIFTVFGIAGIIPTVAGLGFLLYLVSADVKNNTNIKNVKTILQINEEELQVLNHQFVNREDGAAFMPADHAYATDLDIFGKASIFQWLNRCYTHQGQQLLAQNLLHPASVEIISSRQDAAKEIASNLSWRQQWQSYSMQTTVTTNTEKKIMAWSDEEEKHFSNPAWKIIVNGYTCITLGTAMASITGYLAANIFSGLFLLYLILSTFLSRNTIKAYNSLNGIVKEISTLQSMMAWLETASFQSAHLKSLQSKIKSGNSSAAKEITALKIILDRFDLKTSIVGILFFNSFLLWDVRQMIALNSWRKRNKALLSKWFEAVAEMEVVHSISTLHFNKPCWSFPKFSTSHFILESKGIGHPLLPEEQRITNDFGLQGLAKIGLITGSNMAGKSTFLRSLGVNIV
ncbi:MAG: hypothetical protein M3Y85_02090, partial [Bacteroidota bacterium]|nr:hypothetical protein [Bacteroidota bacterium]